MAALDVSTRLAFDRTRVAYDRTMMAWIRTATSLITFGFSVYKFFELEAGRVHEHQYRIGPRQFALLMVGVGLVSLLVGTIEHRRHMQGLIEQYPEIQRSGAYVVAA